MPLAYIDPNTVQHFFGSFGPFLGAVVAILAFLLWPFRYGWRYVRARYPTWPRGVRVALAVALGGTSGLALSALFAGSSADRSAPVPAASSPASPKVLLLGMDGLDPKIMEAMMDGGELPNFARLRQAGGYRRLQTSNPAESPVAWSTIATGCGPGEHGIFDFLHRDPKTYLPYLSLRKPVMGLGGTSYEKARKRDGFWVYTSRAGIRWLIENGYMRLKEANGKEGREIFQDVDWSKTKAYAMGFSSIYLNLAGREGKGIVQPGEESDVLLAEIARQIESWKDPQTGEPVVHATYRSAIYESAEKENAPDLVVGLKPSYRFSWQTALGAAPLTTIEDNTKPWSGDHLIDPSFVPGIVFSNRPMRAETPKLEDIAPTVLALLGVRIPGHMTGQPLLERQVNFDPRSCD